MVNAIYDREFRESFLICRNAPDMATANRRLILFQHTASGCMVNTPDTVHQGVNSS